MVVTLRIIRASSREKQDLLQSRIAELSAAGFRVLYDDQPADPGWRYAAASITDRTDALMNALTEDVSDVVLSARGGYGASDLLARLDWDRLKRARPKLLVGFSDVSALHSALYARLGWKGLHAPMPATALWRKDGQGGDVDQMLKLLELHAAGRATGAEIPVQGPAVAAEGKLFGGCFTVLAALIGTPYFPKSLAGHLLFIEDTDENPGRIMRCLNQWRDSGALQGVKGIVLGHLRGLGENVADSAPFVLEEFARRIPELPVYHTPLFGHTSPNLPLMIGAPARIDGGRLVWIHKSGKALA